MLEVAWLGAQLLLGILLADFMTGLIHWFMDRYGRTHWPVIGGAIWMNQEHHRRPRLFLTGTVWTRNREVLIVSLAVLALFWAVGALSPFVAAFALSGCFANEIHAAAHRRREENPAWAIETWPVSSTT